MKHVRACCQAVAGIQSRGGETPTLYLSNKEHEDGGLRAHHNKREGRQASSCTATMADNGGVSRRPESRHKQKERLTSWRSRSSRLIAAIPVRSPSSSKLPTTLKQRAQRQLRWSHRSRSVPLRYQLMFASRCHIHHGFCFSGQK